ncbi:hypothetical protein PANT_14c00113 [Moesziomyces antarcticus T-34]|uniref:Large ribosomal subunit protein mL43 n=1 Tax=Pseudozyma antarctica (strain T-34) TaxID=1151754 RepID=M9LXE0_PSEA3|nr:hypothetical protein PANT_14c00113 [Moesziomyces antarcticus T-34]
MSYLKSFSRILRGSLSTTPGGVSGTPGSFHLPLRKLVLRYSQHNPSSAGTRAFLLSSTFLQLSKKYPSVEFVVTEAGNAKHPLVTGFYADNSAAAFRSDKRKDISLANLDAGQVGAKVQRVVEASGDKTKSLKRRTTLSRNESARGQLLPPRRLWSESMKAGASSALARLSPHHSIMRLPVLFSLLSLATWAASSPAGGAVEELGGAVEQAATSASPAAWRPELEDLSSFVSPGRAAWRKYLATLSTHPPPPLRYATRAELADIQHARFVEHPSVAKLGIIEPGHAFIGQTPKGRLVFKAPDLHGITMYVPAKGHIMADQLVARKRGDWVEVINWGPVNTHGFAPEDLHDVAIKTNRGYLVRDKVPMNRVAWTRQQGDRWDTPTSS